MNWRTLNLLCIPVEQEKREISRKQWSSNESSMEVDYGARELSMIGFDGRMDFQI